MWQVTNKFIWFEPFSSNVLMKYSLSCTICFLLITFHTVGIFISQKEITIYAFIHKKSLFLLAGVLFCVLEDMLSVLWVHRILVTTRLSSFSSAVFMQFSLHCSGMGSGCCTFFSDVIFLPINLAILSLPFMVRCNLCFVKSLLMDVVSNTSECFINFNIFLSLQV